MPFFDDTSFADIPIKLTPPSFFSMVYFPKGVATVMWCLVFSTTPYTVPDGACLLYLIGYTLYGICHIGVVTLCKTGCGGSYYHHQRNHNLLHTLLYIKGLYFIVLVPRIILFYRFPITSAKVRRLFLSAKYLNLPCMKCHSVCTK